MRAWVANPNDDQAADAIEASELETGTTRTRCVATMLEGGHAPNALPQKAEANVNCRALAGHRRSSTAGRASGDRRTQGQGHRRRARTSRARPRRCATTCSAPTRARSAALYGADTPIIPHMSTGATDGLFFRQVGIPVYGVEASWGISPDDERAHGLDERIPVRAFYDNIVHWENYAARPRGLERLRRLQHFGGVAGDLDLAPRLHDPAVVADEEGRALHAHIFAAVHRSFRPRCRRRRKWRRPRRSASGTLRSYLPMNFSCFFIGSRDTPTTLRPGLREIARERGEILRLAGAARRVVLGVEIEHQRLARRRRDRSSTRRSPPPSAPAPCRLRRSSPAPSPCAQRSAILCRASPTASSSKSQSSWPHSRATSARDCSAGSIVPGATRRRTTRIRLSRRRSRIGLVVDQPRLGQARRSPPRAAGRCPIWLVSWSVWTANSRSTSPPGPELDVERARGRLVARHLGAHLGGVGADLGRIADVLEDRADQVRDLLAAPPSLPVSGRARHSAICSHVHASRALILLERIERDREHALRALRPEPGVDLVERAGRGRDRQRRASPGSPAGCNNRSPTAASRRR